MLIPRFVTGMSWIVVMFLGAGVASAQNYPSRPIRIVLAQPGGSTDFVARLFASAISGPLGQQVIIDNRAAVLPGELVAKATPDGYTLLQDGISLWIAPLLQETPYDMARDFAPITLTDKSPSVLVVHPSQPINSVKELIALAKAKPGAINFGSSSPGSTPHLNTEMFKSMAGVNIVIVPYKGSGPAALALIAGETQVMIATAASVSAHIKSGKLRALAVTSPQPSALFPGLPTIASSGLPGYESETIGGAFVPAKTPAAIINRLNQEIVRALKSADLKEKFLSAGMESVGTTPEEFAAVIKSSIARWGKVIKDAGIRIQ